MKLTTIWTLPGMAFAERVRRTVDSVACSVAYRLPKRIKYWAYIHVGSGVMRPDEVVPEVTYMELLERVSR
jgi:hypothetical protein